MGIAADVGIVIELAMHGTLICVREPLLTTRLRSDSLAMDRRDRQPRPKVLPVLPIQFQLRTARATCAEGGLDLSLALGICSRTFQNPTRQPQNRF